MWIKYEFAVFTSSGFTCPSSWWCMLVAGFWMTWCYGNQWLQSQSIRKKLTVSCLAQHGVHILLLSWCIKVQYQRAFLHASQESSMVRASVLLWCTVVTCIVKVALMVARWACLCLEDFLGRYVIAVEVLLQDVVNSVASLVLWFYNKTVKIQLTCKPRVRLGL